MYARHAVLIATPVGPVAIEGTPVHVTAVRIAFDDHPGGEAGPAVSTAAEQILAYFAGRLSRFDVPLAPAATARGDVLRQAIIGIGHGRTTTYGELAASCSSSARAIGQACARNPLPILVPCHRVLGAGGVAGAYSAGGGARTKIWLLDHERAHSEG